MNRLNLVLLAALFSGSFAFARYAAILADEPSDTDRFIFRGEGEPADGGIAVLHSNEESPLFRAIDLDGDGVLSAEEIFQAPESLAALDRNHDGQVTPDEIVSGGRRLFRVLEAGDGDVEPRVLEFERRGAPREGAVIRITDPVLKLLDVDGDGILSVDEIAESWIVLLDLDADIDGALTLDVIRSLRLE